MVDPITMGTVAKGFEGAASLGVEAAKSAAGSAQASAFGAGGAQGGMGGGSKVLWEGSGIRGNLPANPIGAQGGMGGGPMPGGGQGGMGNDGWQKMGGGGYWRDRGYAPEPKELSGKVQERSTIQKIGDFLKDHKIGDKLELISQTQHSLNRFGTDMMGPDAKKYNPETETHRSTPRWK